MSFVRRRPKNTIEFYSEGPPTKYTNFLSRNLDWLGRSIAFLSARESAAISGNDEKQTPLTKWQSFKIKLWNHQIGSVVGLPGALLRYAASYGNENQYSYEPGSLEIINRETTEIKNTTSFITRLLTLNIGCLPEVCNKRVTSVPMRLNAERVDFIVKQFSKDVPDMVALQEVFARDVEKKLTSELKNSYGCMVRNVGRTFLSVGSGLLFLTKYPILDADFQAFSNLRLSEETLANKGVGAIKVWIGLNYFMTVYITHLHADGRIPLLSVISDFFNGTDAERRNEEMEMICNHMEEWERIPPPNHPELKYAGTIFAGDINVVLNELKSTPRLLSRLQNTLPTNYLKPFTGTTIDLAVMKRNLELKLDEAIVRPDETEKKVLDIAAVVNPTSPDDLQVNSESHVTTEFNTSTDHFGVKLTVEFVPKPNGVK
jgi:hypothetical protein